VKYNGYFLIVGFGSIGQRHFTNLKLVAPDLKVIVYRPSKKLSSEERKIEGAFLVSDSMQEALAEPLVGAIIATPAVFHIEMAKNLIEKKVPVLMEKPVSAELSEAISFAELLQTHNVPLLVGYNFRFSKTAQKFKQLVEEGAIGKVLTASIEMGFHLPSWRPHQDYRKGVSAQKKMGGGVLLELSHALDLYLWFFSMPDRVFAQINQLGDFEIDVEDNVDLFLESDLPRMTAHLHLDMLQRKASRHFKIVGTEGSLIWNMVTQSLQLVKLDSEQDLSIEEAWNDMYVHEIEHFLDCIYTKQLPMIGFEDGLKVLQLVDAARKSSQARASVSLFKETS